MSGNAMTRRHQLLARFVVVGLMTVSFFGAGSIARSAPFFCEEATASGPKPELDVPFAVTEGRQCWEFLTACIGICYKACNGDQQCMDDCGSACLIGYGICKLCSSGVVPPGLEEWVCFWT